MSADDDPLFTFYFGPSADLFCPEHDTKVASQL